MGFVHLLHPVAEAQDCGREIASGELADSVEDFGAIRVVEASDQPRYPPVMENRGRLLQVWVRDATREAHERANDLLGGLESRHDSLEVSRRVDGSEVDLGQEAVEVVAIFRVCV